MTFECCSGRASDSAVEKLAATAVSSDAPACDRESLRGYERVREKEAHTEILRGRGMLSSHLLLVLRVCAGVDEVVQQDRHAYLEKWVSQQCVCARVCECV
jgi:hypothetical protein